MSHSDIVIAARESELNWFEILTLNTAILQTSGCHLAII